VVYVTEERSEVKSLIPLNLPYLESKVRDGSSEIGVGRGFLDQTMPYLLPPTFISGHPDRSTACLTG